MKLSLFMRSSSFVIFASALAVMGCGQQVTLTGTGVTPPAPGLTLSSEAISFGNVFLGIPSTQDLTMTSSGTAPVTVSAITVSGAPFSVDTPPLPLTLAPQATGQIEVMFDPTVAGNDTGTVTVISNAYSSPVQTVTCSGTATNGAVALTWNAPAPGAPDPAVGFNVYRAAAGTGVYVQLNSTMIPLATTAYTDSTVTSGQSYAYIVESVDAKGVLSLPSNTATVTVP